jgi:hypothetical protein
MTSKEMLHRLVDALPENELAAAERLLTALLAPDAMLRALDSAPEDDESSSAEEDAEAEAAWQEYLRGESVAAEEARRRLLP